ncbi:MAG: dTDP-4-dehydrorhamnose 3,5-epimerase [bacterium]
MDETRSSDTRKNLRVFSVKDYIRILERNLSVLIHLPEMKRQSITVRTTNLEGVLLISIDYFEDHRGEYVETYNRRDYHKAGITYDFLEDDYSRSYQNVLRGIHGDAETSKLISCLYGKFYLVVVDCRTESSHFGMWQSFVLSDRNKRQVLIPPGFGNGHLVLSEEAIFHYKQSAYYNPTAQFTYRYDDPRFNIWWPVKNPILSRRDEFGQCVSLAAKGVSLP